MNFSLLDKIRNLETGFVATVLSTEGHTYAKAGARALFRTGDPVPAAGNLGSLCADQELVRQGEAACHEGVPKRIRIDASDPDDADIGYGTQCGGAMDVLVEPLLDGHRELYRRLADRLRQDQTTFLEHDVTSGTLILHDSPPKTHDEALIERIDPLRKVHVFGATPLAQQLVDILSGAPYDVHVFDWRGAYLDAIGGLDRSRVRLAPTDQMGLGPSSIVVIVSHSFRRDKAVVKEALARGCGYVGMLSSSARRDRMYDELAQEGVPPEQLERVSCPIGIDIGGRGDAEIAVSIAAEVMRFGGS